MDGSDILPIEYDTLGALLSCVSNVGRAAASATSHVIHVHTCLHLAQMMIGRNAERLEGL